jgi:hypothetical protein
MAEIDDDVKKTPEEEQVDQNQEQEIDFDEMSDEDFLKLSEEDAMKAIDSQKPGEGDDGKTEENNESDSDNADDDDDSQSQSDPDESADSSEDSDSSTKESELKDETSESDPEKESQSGEQSDADSKEEKKKAATKLPDGVSFDDAITAIEFMKQMTAPFKADGRDFQIRSPEDAIRLMQQGANYSRRMHELKPIKHLHRMLQDNGLADQNKLNFLIDVAKGNKDAIAKLLKDHNIETVDLDTDGENKYQARNYAGTQQQQAFRDALDAATMQPEGQSLVQEIHTTWDTESKNKLRENPTILGNLVELRKAGVYQQVAEELDYQRSMGYLTDVPYLQAFDAVGDAMKNAGVIKLPNQPGPAPNGQSQGNHNSGQPVASGGRKAEAPKATPPNPNLSSAPVSKQSKTPPAPKEPNFDAMSDEEFLKMRPPS